LIEQGCQEEEVINSALDEYNQAQKQISSKAMKNDFDSWNSVLNNDNSKYIWEKND